MAIVSYTMQVDMIVNGKLREEGAVISVATAEPMTLLDLEAVNAATGEDDVLPTEE